MSELRPHDPMITGILLRPGPAPFDFGDTPWLTLVAPWPVRAEEQPLAPDFGTEGPPRARHVALSAHVLALASAPARSPSSKGFAGRGRQQPD